MEKFVLGAFQEKLSKVLIGFRKEQINTNLLNGKGEIRDVNLNCSFINDELSKITPFITLESIRVSKLGFNVTNWTKLYTAPICVDIEDVFVTIVEPFSYLDESQRRLMKQLSAEEFRKMMTGKKPRGSYSLIDRIIDNLQFEIRSINISFQTHGKFKTRRVGPWTPPQILVSLRHLKYRSVNKFGNDASPDECWQHNKNAGKVSDREVLIYKRVSMDFSLSFKDSKDNQLPALIHDAHVDTQIIFNKKVINAGILAVQIDATLNQLYINLDQKTVPVMAHALAGLQYCFLKDRSFEDPLISGTTKSTGSSDKIKTVQSIIVQTNEETETFEDSDDEEGEEGSVALDESIEVTITGETPDNTDDNEYSFIDVDDKTATSENEVSAEDAVRRRKNPVLVLPSGVVILKKVSASLSIKDCKVRGIYSRNGDDFIELRAKGLVTEFIWPKVSREKGCHLQFSLASLRIHEIHNKKVRVLVRGGNQHGYGMEIFDATDGKSPPTANDETFPFFEDRCIQPDPIGLRHSSPTQAFGYKGTVSFIQKLSNAEEDEILVENEIGVNSFDILLDSEPWCRAIRFGSNEAAGGFDYRWYTGDWTELLSADMLHHPLKPLILSDHCQAISLFLVDENKLISSDLFNLTAKISCITAKIPGVLQKDIHSCDIVMEMKESIILVSSALPRTFLTGKIGSSIRGDQSDRKMNIDFPNDPSDICFSLERSEDPLIRQQGTQTSRRISTFRTQISVQGVAVRLSPIIPYRNATEPQELLSPLQMIMMICFEGEPPTPINPDEMKITLFTSMKIHQLNMNFDLDLILGATSSILFHYAIINESLATIIDMIIDLASKVGKTDPNTVIGSEGGINKKLGGGNSLAKRQMQRSRDTGGLGIEFCLQLDYLGLHLWRQNVAVNSGFRGSISGNTKNIDTYPIPIVKLLCVEVSEVEIGAEAMLQEGWQRKILKCCVSELDVEVCDFEKAWTRHYQSMQDGGPIHKAQQNNTVDEVSSMEKEDRFDSVEDGNDLMLVFSIGSEGKDIMIRLEELNETTRVFTFAADTHAGGELTLHIEEIEFLFLLLVEFLLSPTKAKGPINSSHSEHGIKFPEGSAGALFLMLSKMLIKDEELSLVMDFQKILLKSQSVRELIDQILLTILPADTDQLLIRLDVNDFLLFVPHIAGNADKDCKDGPWLAYHLKNAKILSTYLRRTKTVNDNIMKIFSKKGMSWNNLTTNFDEGFYHDIKASQALHCAELMGTSVKIKSKLIDPFTVGVNINQQKITFSIDDPTFSIEDFENIKRLSFSLQAFTKRYDLMQHRINSVITALSYERDNKVSNTMRSHQNSIGKENIDSIVMEAESSLRSGKRDLERLVGLLDDYESKIRAIVGEKQSKIDQLQVQVFLKERSRVAALALVSCQAAGWLRVGGMHLGNERSPTTANMWRHHAILRKSLLILYSGPGQSRPLDLVDLSGASLLELAGGRRKTDIKHGFAIRERKNGCIRFFLAPNSSDLELWTSKIKKAIATFSADEKYDNNDLEEAYTEKENSNKIDGTLDKERSGIEFLKNTSMSERGKKVRNKFNQVTSSARNFGSTIQTRRQRTNTNENVITENTANFDDLIVTENDISNIASNPPIDQAGKIDSVEGISIDTSKQNTASNIDIGLPIEIKKPNTNSNESPEILDAGSLNIAKNNARGTEKNHKINPLSQSNETSKDKSPPATTNRFADIRMNAKNRLNSAMVGAREKALRRKQDRGSTNTSPSRLRPLQSTEEESAEVESFKNDSNSTKVGSQFRSRFSQLGSAVRNTGNNLKIGNNSSIEEEKTLNRSLHNIQSGSQSLIKESDLSDGLSASIIEAEETDAISSHGVLDDSDEEAEKSQNINTSHRNESNNKSNLVVGNNESSRGTNVGQQMRNRFSQFGSAVRQTNQRLKGENTPTTEGDTTKGSRFSIRRGNFKKSDRSDNITTNLGVIKEKSSLQTSVEIPVEQNEYEKLSTSSHSDNLEKSMEISVPPIYAQRENITEDSSSNMLKAVEINATPSPEKLKDDEGESKSSQNINPLQTNEPITKSNSGIDNNGSSRGSNVGQQMRNRFSQFGSAVRQTNQRMRGENSPTTEGDNKGSRFSIRRGNFKKPDNQEGITLSRGIIKENDSLQTSTEIEQNEYEKLSTSSHSESTEKVEEAGAPPISEQINEDGNKIVNISSQYNPSQVDENKNDTDAVVDDHGRANVGMQIRNRFSQLGSVVRQSGQNLKSRNSLSSDEEFSKNYRFSTPRKEQKLSEESDASEMFYNDQERLEESGISPRSSEQSQGDGDETIKHPVDCRSELSFEENEDEAAVVIGVSDSSRANVGLQIRNRFSQLGSAVRQTNQNLRSVNSLSTEEESSKTPRFTIRRGNMKPTEESHLVKLKAVRAGGNFKINEPEIKAPVTSDVFLTSIKGNWFVYAKTQENEKFKDGLLSQPGLIVSNHGSVNSTTSASDGNESLPGNNLTSNYTFLYEIKVVSHDPGNEGKIKSKAFTRDFHEVISLFIDVMESIASINEDTPSKSKEFPRNVTADVENEFVSTLDLSPLEIVKITGDLLGGLLSASSSFQSVSAFHGYQCEVLSEFLNAALSCPMPVDACIAVLEFLELADAGTVPANTALEEGDRNLGDFRRKGDNEEKVATDIINHIMALKSSCLSHLERARIDGILSQKLLRNEEHVYLKRKKQYLSDKLTVPVTALHLDFPVSSGMPSDLTSAMQKSLVSVMAERDESQADRIAASVMHAQAMDSERRSMELTKRKLRVAEENVKLLSQRWSEKNLAKMKESKELQKYFEERCASSEEEIFHLHKQLAVEISNKASSEMRIKSLEESHKIEKENHAREIQALSEELRNMRNQLQKANAKLNKTENII